MFGSTGECTAGAASDAAPRGRLPSARPAIVACAMLTMMLGAAVSACGAEPTPSAPVPEADAGNATRVARGVGPTVVDATTPGRADAERDAGVDAGTTPTAAPAPRAVSVTSRPLTGGTGDPYLPGPWSPDGSSLVAYRILREDPVLGPIGRVGVIDVTADGTPTSDGAQAGDDTAADDTAGDDTARGPVLAPRLVWESGDVIGAVERSEAAVWRADGTLLLARGDRPLVDEDGVPLDPDGASSDAIDGQVITVALAPNGRTALLVGPERAWLHDGGRSFVPVVIPGGEPMVAWDWRFDSGAVALVAGDGYYVLDAGDADVSRVGSIPTRDDGVADALPPPAPRWLADGRILLPAPRSSPGLPGQAIRLADPDGDRGRDVHQVLGIGPNPVMPRDVGDGVSPDGHWLLYPQVERRDGTETLARTWRLDVLTGEVMALDPVGGPISWSADGRYAAWHDVGGLHVLVADSGQRRTLVDGTVRRHAWSDRGPWLVYADGAGHPWIVRADGRAGPQRLAEAPWTGPADWARGDEAVALSVLVDGVATLSVYELAVEGVAAAQPTVPAVVDRPMVSARDAP